MRILRIVYEWPVPWDSLAAAPYEMTQSQVGLGHQIDVFCGRWPRAGAMEQLPNVKLHPFLREPLQGTLNLTTSVAMFFYYLFWRRKNQVDVIHSHGHFGIWIYWYRRFLAKKFPKSEEIKTPIVVHFHNTVAGRRKTMEDSGKKVKSISKSLAWPLAEKSDRMAVEVADAMIFVSQDTMKEAIELYKADPAKCYVVETGVNTKLFSQIGPEERFKTRKDLGLLQTDKIVLNHGIMLERKNIHILIEALKFLPLEYKLLLVGPTPDSEYELKLATAIKENKLTSRVIRVGYTPYPEVPIAFQAADIFVLPSEWEGLPKVVMQSLASGVPVLASGFKATQDITGLFYLQNLEPQTIATQIQVVIKSEARVDVGFVKMHYSWDVMARKVDAIYGKVVKAV